MWPKASNVVSWGRDGEVGKAGLELTGGIISAGSGTQGLSLVVWYLSLG